LRLEGLRVQHDASVTRRTIRFAWIGGDMEVGVEVPSEYAPDDSDCSPFVPAALLVAMRRAEPLQIDGVVSRRLLESLPLAQEILSSWNPTMRRIAVRAAAVDESPAEPDARRACFFSRGIDSTYSAAIDRAAGDELASLVHWRDFEFRYSEPTREREVELAYETARLVDLPMVVVRSDVPRALVGVVDFNDATSAMLASVALSLPGLAGRTVIPSATGYGDLVPVGCHPLLDPLWSTERVAVEHDLCPLREEKVRWLVENRPDLLPLIHVCMEQDSTENCGRCGKCVWAMMLLYLHGGLERAPFPDRLDPDQVKNAYRGMPHQLAGSDRVYKQLGDSREHRAFKRALLKGMRKSTRKPMARGGLGIIPIYGRRTHQLLHGHLSDVPTKVTGTAGAEVGPLDPSWPPPREVPCGLLGLVRAVDGDERRHRYAAGELPPGERSGELGALLSDRPEDGVPLVLDGDGRPALNGEHPGSALATARWIGEPLVWRTGGTPVARVRSAARRANDARAAFRPNGRVPRGAADSRGAAPVGWLHRGGGDGRLALLAARHPVLDDVLLTTDPDEARRLGYVEPETLGYLEPHAPITGVAGPAAVTIPWARHWGQG
jgi:hypothetical protein